MAESVAPEPDHAPRADDPVPPVTQSSTTDAPPDEVIVNADTEPANRDRPRPAVTAREPAEFERRPARAGRLADPEYRAQRVAELQQQEEEALARARAWAERTGEPMRIETNDTVMVLIDYTDETGPIYRSTLNVQAAISTAADQLRIAPYELTGQGILGGIWDGGDVRATHAEFQTNRVSNQNAAGNNNHATHVAGTMIARGANANALGMAPAASLLAYDFFNDLSEMTFRAMASPGEPDTIQISNHSYGYAAGWAHQFTPRRWYGTWSPGVRESDHFGRYSIADHDRDALLYEAPYYLPFIAAGNDRNDVPPTSGTNFQYLQGGTWQTKPYDPDTDPYPDGWKEGGYNTIPYGNGLKNALVVGAVNDAVSEGERDIGSATMSNFSSWGPTDDGRIKPDLVANGVGLYSASSSGNNSYTTMSGTSMATPNASGSALLLLELQQQLFPGTYLTASAIKGLLLHTADSLDDPGPDYRHGWGLMNAQAAADQLLAHAEHPEAGFLIEDSIDHTNDVRTYTIHWNGEDALRATLVWTDPPGPDNLVGLNLTNLTLVNDLDLRIISPSGTTNYPWVLDPSAPSQPATTGDNVRDNVEQVKLAEPTEMGIYTVQVTFKDTLFDEHQAYALLISGQEPGLVIEHEPLENQYDTNATIQVDAHFFPPARFDLTETALRWNTTGDTNSFASVPFTWIEDTLHRAEIPPQTLGETVYYWIDGRSIADQPIAFPPDAPGTLLSFDITEPVTLTVTGAPNALGTVLPGYGAHVYAAGNEVAVAADEFVPGSTADYRYRNLGWTGTGSLATGGVDRTFAFTIEEDSELTWVWGIQYRLNQTANLPDVVDHSTWWDADAFAETVAAPDPVQIESTVYRFTEWRVDDLRQADPVTGVAVNPAPQILMSNARSALAIYVDESLDTDDSGLPDWWQLYYFGALGIDPNADADGDGFSNLEEFLEGTNPLDTNDFPMPLVITHAPLADPQTIPAPWSVIANLDRPDALGSVVLEWSRNHAGWQQTPMTATVEAPGQFTALISETNSLGDTITYRLIATSASGLITTNGPHSFDVAYPVLIDTALSPLQLLLKPGEEQDGTILFSNAGNATLTWTLEVEELGYTQDFDQGAPGWDSFGDQNFWHLSTNRAWTGTQAWYNGIPGTRAHSAFMYAVLETPPIVVGDDAPELTFWQWMDAELGFSAGTAFHGGLVQVSDDGGETFAEITPVGGYPYTLADYGDGSLPFEAGTPIFAGTGGWEYVRFDLESYAESTLIFRFIFGTDSFYNGLQEGWYIDDVRVTPMTGAENWLTAPADTGALAPGETVPLVWTWSASPDLSGQDRAARVRAVSNDPVLPERTWDFDLLVRSPPTIVSLDASQQPADGSGRVAIDLSLFDPDLELLEVELEYSRDGGTTWQQAWLIDGSAGIGPAPTLLNDPSVSVAGVATAVLDEPQTNSLVLGWDTTYAPALTTDMVEVRVRISDEWYTTEWQSTPPFLVDNIPPDTSLAVVEIQTSPLGPYVIGESLSAIWSGFTDEGTGIAGYRLYWSDEAADPEAGIDVSIMSGTLTGAVVNATNTIHVQAYDHVGNHSDPVSASVMVLDPFGDSDGDGMNNQQKELAGLSAIDGPTFSAQPSTLTAAPTTPTLRWPHAPDREYVIHWTEDTLNGDTQWSTQVLTPADYTVEDGYGLWQDDQPLPAPPARRYYRIEVRLADP